MLALLLLRQLGEGEALLECVATPTTQVRTGVGHNRGVFFDAHPSLTSLMCRFLAPPGAGLPATENEKKL